MFGQVGGGISGQSAPGRKRSGYALNVFYFRQRMSLFAGSDRNAYAEFPALASEQALGDCSIRQIAGAALYSA